MIEAAITVADEQGIAAVTLRSVADRSNVTFVDVQREFGSRDRLVATMVQRIFASRRRPTASDIDSIGTLTQLAEYEWQAYQDHPWLVGVLASTRPPLVPALLDLVNAVIEAFARLGLDADAALDRYVALSAYIQGMGLLLVAEHQESARTGMSYRTWWSVEARRMDRTGGAMQHPRIRELTDQPDSIAFDANACFRDGLGRVVKGLVEY